MSLSLSPDLEAAVLKKVESGSYRDANDVVRQALRSLERDPGAREQELRAAIQRGVDDLETGRYTVIQNREELEAFFRDL